MYQYSNDAYNSADTLPHNRFRYNNNGPNHSETVGIGYYGVSRNSQIKGRKPDMATATATLGGSSLISPISPSSARPLDTSAEHSSYLWNYMHEGVDLSPQASQARVSRSNMKSPTRPLSEGSMLEAFSRSQMSSNQKPGSSSVPALGYSEYSPQSTEQSSHSFLEYPLLKKHSGVGSPAPQAPMSLRARWEQTHKAHGQDGVPMSHTPMMQQRSSDSITRSVRSNKDLSGDVQRQSDGEKPSRRYFANVATDQSPQSTLERDYNTYSTSSSLRRDPLSHRKLTNGSVRAVRDGSLNTSRRSLNISHSSLRSQAGKATLYGKGYGVHNSLVNMGLAALLSLIMCYLSVQLLFRVSTRQSTYLFSTDSVLTSNVSYADVSEVVVALTSIAIMLDLCCLLTCVLQGYFAAKLMKCKQGQERNQNALHFGQC
ncbi:hypothetical protein LSH36_722g01041 [Paralvinella palmiformis]|uniref:Uncharacterized protein n=1 Tax=Paralvinella palmiformis TaxID=53620 RepID=A0AAD9J2Q5_9ANNE|nr:hypothetical protein LSH36_722g01041 [Paralvinella palmiformis]